MSSEDISDVVKELAKEFNGDMKELIGEESCNNKLFYSIYIGISSHRDPRFVKLN